MDTIKENANAQHLALEKELNVLLHKVEATRLPFKKTRLRSDIEKVGNRLFSDNDTRQRFIRDYDASLTEQKDKFKVITASFNDSASRLRDLDVWTEKPLQQEYQDARDMADKMMQDASLANIFLPKIKQY